MGDTKNGRAKKARKEETRQLKRELEEERERLDEPEPPEDDEDVDVADLESDGGPNSPRTCHRRGCEEPAEYIAVERYQEETGHGAVEAEALLCRDHVTEEHPTNLEGVYEDYVFRVEPLPGTVD